MARENANIEITPEDNPNKPVELVGDEEVEKEIRNGFWKEHGGAEVGHAFHACVDTGQHGSISGMKDKDTTAIALDTVGLSREMQSFKNLQSQICRDFLCSYFNSETSLSSDQQRMLLALDIKVAKLEQQLAVHKKAVQPFIPALCNADESPVRLEPLEGRERYAERLKSDELDAKGLLDKVLTTPKGRPRKENIIEWIERVYPDRRDHEMTQADLGRMDQKAYAAFRNYKQNNKQFDVIEFGLPPIKEANNQRLIDAGIHLDPSNYSARSFVLSALRTFK